MYVHHYYFLWRTRIWIKLDMLTDAYLFKIYCAIWINVYRWIAKFYVDAKNLNCSF